MLDMLDVPDEADTYRDLSGGKNTSFTANKTNTAKESCAELSIFNVFPAVFLAVSTLFNTRTDALYGY
jgi:hypothetical protein